MTKLKKLTPKQEAFAMAYVETGNASEAYRRSYNAEKMQQQTIWVKSCELLSSGNVSVKVAELQQTARERHTVTVQALTIELDEARAQAKKDPKGAAAHVAAIMGKAKLHGLLVEKKELTGKGGGPIEVAGVPASERLAGLLDKVAPVAVDDD